MDRLTPRRDRGHAIAVSTGFTLVELLVVIGIIGVLLGVLLPALGKARASGQRSVCLSNLREIAHGLQMYLVESKGVLPPFGANYGGTGVANFADEDVYGRYPSALGSLMPYLKDRRLFACPAVDPERAHPTTGAPPTATSDTNYAANGVLAGRKVSRIKSASDLVYLQESYYRSSVCWYRPVNSNKADPLVPFTWWHSDSKGTEEFNNTHHRGGNLLFLDGHAEWRECKSIRAADFGLTGAAGYTGKATDDWTADFLLTYRSAVN